jgi:hypothetical protein
LHVEDLLAIGKNACIRKLEKNHTANTLAWTKINGCAKYITHIGPHCPSKATHTNCWCVAFEGQWGPMWTSTHNHHSIHWMSLHWLSCGWTSTTES